MARQPSISSASTCCTGVPDITDTLVVALKLESLTATAEPLLSKTITPTKAIEELLKDSALQLWVKQGMAHHRAKRDTCAFCRQDLPHDIWQILDEHFSKESGDLETSLDAAITSVTAEIGTIAGLNIFTGAQFYPDERTAFEASSKALTQALAVYKKDLEELKKSLETRKNSLFQPTALKTPSYDAKEIAKHVADINALIGTSNSKTATLEKHKTSAREALRLADVFAFAEAITYNKELGRIATLKATADTASTACTDAEKEIRDAEAEIRKRTVNPC